MKKYKILKKKFLFIGSFLFIIMLLLMLLFYNKDATEVTIVIANERYTFTQNDTSNEINLSTLNSEFNTVIKKDNILYDVKINGEKFFSKKDLGILEIDKNNKLELEIKFSGDSKYTKYFINTLPTNMPKFDCIGESKTKGDFYFTTYGAHYGENNSSSGIYLLKLNNNGKILFYRKAGYKSYTFKKEIINNKVYYSYLDENISNGKVSLYILDEKYNLIKEINNIGNSVNQSIDFHDYLVIDLNNYIFSDMNSDGDEIISEIKNNELVWEYKFPARELETVDVNGNKILKKMDLHFNSFELDYDNNLLISFRHSDEIVKINRSTGDLMWVLGGENNDFDKSFFKKQHSIVRVDDNYIVFNNNGSVFRRFIGTDVESSIVVFNLNQENKKATKLKNYNLGCYSYELGGVWPSNFDNNVYVVSYGRSEDKGQKAFEEINLETGKVHFTFEYPDIVSTVYRVYKY